jgi:hypothetical protein
MEDININPNGKREAGTARLTKAYIHHIVPKISSTWKANPSK